MAQVFFKVMKKTDAFEEDTKVKLHALLKV